MKNTFLWIYRLLNLFIITCFCSLPIYAQNQQITGRVLDKGNEPVIGASVLVKGTTNGTITDLDGNFRLNNVAKDATIQISYIGYKTQEFKLDGKTHFPITLDEDTQTLDEVVVVGYGVQRKSDLTGAVASVKAADALKGTPVSDITNALQGRLAGVSIMSSSGQPGSSATIRVRGSNSLASESGPLIVIDGLMGGSLSSLNPSDIASVEVLKDASATAIYGSKGSAGVILITTKNPESGKVNVEYNGYINFKTPYELPEMMSAGQFAELANDYVNEINASTGSSMSEFYTPEQIQEFYQNGGYDYIDKVFRNMSIEHTHELSISGGSEKTKFLFSGSYNDNQGIVNNSWGKRFNYRLKVDTDIRKWLKVGLNFWGDYQKSSSIRFSQYNNLLIGALTYPNTLSPTDENGDYRTNNLISPQYNPSIFVDTPQNDGYIYTSRLQGYVDVKLAKGLNFRMTQGFTFYNRNTQNLYGTGSYEYYQSYGQQTSADARSYHNYSWINTNILSYIREFNEDHRINATAVLEQQYANNYYLRGFGRDLISEKLGYDALGMSSLHTVESERDITTMLSYLLRANYVFKNRYMVTASWRRDGSSALAKDNRWENFWAMALAWDFKKEKFMQQVDFMDQFKLRFGYGENGNQTMPSGQDYLAWTQITAEKDKDGNLSFVTERLANRDVRWERTSQFNYGLDLGFFNNRLTASVDYYTKETKDVLLYVNMPIYTGFTSRYANAGTVTNKGFEITLGADPVVTKNFRWNTSVTLSRNIGKVKELADGNSYADLSGNYENKYFRNIVGEKIATMWGYRNEGVWTSEEVNAGLAPVGTEAGSYKYKDKDNNGVIDENDREIIGNGQPSFQWSWNNALSYKGFDFSLFVIGVHGFDIYNYTREARLSTNGSIVLSPTPEWENRWTPENDKNTGVAGFIGNRNALTPSSQYVENGSFVKVKSITLGYTFPENWMKKATINRLRVYVSLQNPFLFTGYSGMDPEVTLQKSLTSGIDWGYYPNGRNYLVGLNLSF